MKAPLLKTQYPGTPLLHYERLRSAICVTGAVTKVNTRMQRRVDAKPAE